MPAPTLPAASNTLITNLIASLGNATHGWTVSARVINPPPGADNNWGLDPYAVDVTVALVSTKIKQTVGGRAPLGLVLQARYDDAGTFKNAVLTIEGLQYSTTSSSLVTAVLALADAEATAVGTAVAASLAAGPS